MKSRVEKQFQGTTTYLEFGATRSFRNPCPPAPCWGVSGASGVWGYQIQDEHVCRQESGTLRPSNHSGHFEGALGCIQELWGWVVSGDHLETLSPQLLWEELGCWLLVVGVG